MNVSRGRSGSSLMLIEVMVMLLFGFSSYHRSLLRNSGEMQSCRRKAFNLG